MTLLARKPLGQLLLGRGAIHEPQLQLALEEQRRSRHQKLLGEILIERQICSPVQVAEALAESDGIPFVRVSPKVADPAVVAILPRQFLRASGVLPLFLVNGTLTLAMAEPSNIFLIDEIRRRTGMQVQVVAGTHHDIEATLEAYLDEEKAFVVDEVLPELAAGALRLPANALVDQTPADAPVSKLVAYCIHSAIAENATEIHVEPGLRELRIRYRIDGRLMEKLQPPGRLHAPLIARLKQLAAMDPRQCALPQEGTLRLESDERAVTLNVSTVPGRHGEKMVLLVNEDDRTPLKLEKLGFSYEMLKQWRRLIAMPSGLLLVAGPSGSGKRATLYSALQERNTPDSNLCTVEDRVSQSLAGINQFQVDISSGFTFAAMLRAVLKQEPDLLMISDLPDANIARAAAQAALGGRLVLAGLYSADAPSALTRLLHFGVEPHLLGATVIGVLARRLVRKLCPHCRQPYEPSSAERRQFERHGIIPQTLFRPKGCAHCHNLGYSGRVGVHELLVPTDAFADRLSQGITLPDLRALSHDSGMKPLRADALDKVRGGLTTMEEVLRVTS